MQSFDFREKSNLEDPVKRLNLRTFINVRDDT